MQSILTYMKITLFTSNNNRHNYFINLLSNFCDELWVVQEVKTLFRGDDDNQYQNSQIIKSYFEKARAAQDKIFVKQYINTGFKNIKTLPILNGELNKLSNFYLKEFLQSDLYIVFGSSYIKGNLLDFLVANKAINIHAGVSPFYRGADCNFWALYDNNPHLVGTTIHLLSKGLDSGAILYHAISDLKINPYEYTMSSLKAAFQSIVERIRDKSIFKIKPIKQDRSKEIRYTRKHEFNEDIVQEYLSKKIDLKSKPFDNSILKEPFLLKN